MDAKEYLLKVRKICHKFDIENIDCDDCPLQKYDCGLPALIFDGGHSNDESYIDKAIKTVENYKLEERS